MAQQQTSPTPAPLQPAIFRAIQSSITQNQMVEFSRYAQLATITAESFPSVRSINVRGLLVDPSTGRGALKFSTDLRSAKIQEFARGGQVELCWFFPITREQYRLRCQVGIICNEKAVEGAISQTSNVDGLRSILRTDSESLELHQKFWQEHAPQSRNLFELARPGTIKKRENQVGDLDRYEAQEVDEKTPSNNFATILLLPTRCDYLKLPRPADDTRGQITKVQHHESTLQPNRHQIRWLHTFDQDKNEWTSVELNP
mgnify:CR=1 FL=1